MLNGTGEKLRGLFQCPVRGKQDKGTTLAGLEDRPDAGQQFGNEGCFARLRQVDTERTTPLEALALLAQLVTEEERVNVARGDIVVFDMRAFSDGVPLDAASGEGYTLEVGSMKQKFCIPADKNTMRLPSGDQTGKLSSAGSTVSRVSVPRTRSNNQMSPVPSFGSKRVTASRCPSAASTAR